MPQPCQCSKHLRLLALLVFACVWSWMMPSLAKAAGSRRYAVVIGSNEGDSSDVPLAYAHRDAERMADVLRRLSGVYEENLVVLREPDADRVTRVLEEMSTRIEAQLRSGEVDEALLFVYYSGHADMTSMRLHGTRLTFAEFRRLVNATPAKLRVLIMDACRSGDLTRVKGAHPAKPFEIRAEDRLATEGTAIITSSAAGEDAQESERLRGGVFTHHFVTGLLGAADASRDGRVTLSEAYRYGYAQTLRATSEARFIQHPTYAFDLKGREDLVVTELRKTSGLGVLELASAGAYVVFERAKNGAVVADLDAPAGARISLEPGTYLVRRRTDEAAYERLAELAEGRLTRLSADDMRRIPYGSTVRKGYSERRRVAGNVIAGFAVAGPVMPGWGVGMLGSVGTRIDLLPVSLTARFRYGRHEGNNDELHMNQAMYGGDLGVLKLFDIGVLSPGIGLRMGFDWIDQQFSTAGIAPRRSTWALRGGPTIELQYAPTSRFSFYVEGGMDTYLLMASETEPGAPTGDPSLTARVMPYGGIGLSIFAF